VAKVGTLNICPGCRNETGAEQQLTHDLDTDIMSCPKGHTYGAAVIESGEAYTDATPATPAPTPKAQKVETPRPTVASTREAPETLQPPPAMPPQLSTEEIELSPAQKPLEQTPAAPIEDKVQFDTSKDRHVEEEPEAALARAPRPPLSYQPLPGGNVSVMLIVNERDWMSLKAEAEIQQKPPLEYLQERFNYGMDERWFF
jgi:hypothetical protein